MVVSEHDVVVIGAGPTGLTAALELRRLGVAATVVDRLPAPHRQSRATAVLPRSLELLEAAGATELIEARSVRATGADVRDPDGAVLGGYHLDDVPSAYRWFAALPQWRTEAALTERLAAYGGSVARGRHVTSLEERDDHVELVVAGEDGAGEDGSSEVWRARWVVCATGADPTIRHALHEQLEGGEYPRRYLVADVVVEGDLDPHRTAVFVGDAGIAGLLLLPDGHRLVVLDGAPDDAGSEPTSAQVGELLTARVRMPLTVHDLTWSSCFTLHHRVVPRMAGARTFLAGDAAHLSSLFGAFGMNGGVQDAVDIAWKLAMVESGRSQRALLDSYQIERHAEALFRVAASDAMHVGVVSLSGSAADRARSVPAPELAAGAMPSDPAAANLTRTMLDVHYPPGPAIAHVAGPVPCGRRFAEPDAVARTAHLELACAPGVAAPSALLARWRGVLEPAGDAAGRAVPAGAAALIRPDGVVGWSADDPGGADWDALDAHLAAAHRPS